MNNLEKFFASLGVLDTETTGTTDLDDVIEFSIMLNDNNTKNFYTTLFKASMPVPAESSAVHWICDEDLVDAPDFSTNSETIGTLMDHMTYLVGHNVEFDRNMLASNFARKTSSVPDSLLDKSKWICTFKLAKKLFGQDTTNFSNLKLGYLWFKLGLNKTSTRKINPHKAEDDVFMCYSVLVHLIDECISRGIIDPTYDIGMQLLKYCNTPNILKVYPYGKYKGELFEEVARKDRRYLEWMALNSDLLNEELPTFDMDFAETVAYYLDK